MNNSNLQTKAVIIVSHQITAITPSAAGCHGNGDTDGNKKEGTGIPAMMTL